MSSDTHGLTNVKSRLWTQQMQRSFCFALRCVDQCTLGVKCRDSIDSAVMHVHFNVFLRKSEPNQSNFSLQINQNPGTGNVKYVPYYCLLGPPRPLSPKNHLEPAVSLHNQRVRSALAPSPRPSCQRHVRNEQGCHLHLFPVIFAGRLADCDRSRCVDVHDDGEDVVSSGRLLGLHVHEGSEFEFGAGNVGTGVTQWEKGFRCCEVGFVEVGLWWWFEELQRVDRTVGFWWFGNNWFWG
ncbi:hypothetical protein BJ742DRAFT_30575 [Cladochytrium replicatum]|nr:hypothetical protein BJ742DRAFT_30575 [Cladochytrium replicatum]